MNAGIFFLGLIVLVLGVLAGVYAVQGTERYFFGAYEETNVTYPYGMYALPLIVVGLIITLAGAFMPTVTVRRHVVEEKAHNGAGRRKKTVIEEEVEN